MPNSPDLKGLRLLLVEDEFALAVGLADLVADLGADVIGPVASVSDALEVLDQVPEIDAAVLDVNLRDRTSFPVADRLLQRGVPFLFSTAHTRPELPERFARAPVCVKPFSPQVFVQALRGCFGARAAA